ncbi:hypothetical protein [Hyphomicrobium sp. DY-1]|uniref:hypothetical protein n=1 Tax=Hyphomicrobium sp. DY-1 TaxID=3075650 RepID=UPI0039C02C56
MRRSLTAADVGREFGRTAEWVHANWRELVKEKKIPAPILESGHVTWSAAQFYAILDRKLTAQQRAVAAAFRIAQDAALTPQDLDQLDAIAADRAALDQRFSHGGRG